MANQIQLVMYEGYLAGSPELRYTPSGKEVTNFRIGSHRQYTTSAGEVVKEVIWLKITCWGKLAEIVNKYCEKGSHVIVTGTLRAGENGHPNVFQTSDGKNSASYEITANEVRILKGSTTSKADDGPTPMADDDEIPF